jgi:hypothetical protein
MTTIIKHPSPKPQDVEFTYYWNSVIPDVQERENLKFSHLQQIKVLCSLFVTLDEIDAELEFTGKTYESVGRNGTQIKIHPLVALQKSTIAEIRSYSNILGLVLVEDRVMNNMDDRYNEFD